MSIEDSYEYIYELCPMCGDRIDHCTGCEISEDYLNGLL